MDTNLHFFFQNILPISSVRKEEQWKNKENGETENGESMGIFIFTNDFTFQIILLLIM